MNHLDFLEISDRPELNSFTVSNFIKCEIERIRLNPMQSPLSNNEYYRNLTIIHAPVFENDNLLPTDFDAAVVELIKTIKKEYITTR